MEEEEENQHIKILRDLNFNLQMLKDFNKLIPKSVKESADNTVKTIKEKLGKLDDKSRDILRKLIDNELGFAEDFKLLDRKTKDLMIEAFRIIMLPGEFNSFIGDMSLVYLITEFESFLRKSLEITFHKQPKILSSQKKNITYEELLKCEDLDEALQKIMEKEISVIINQDIDEIGKYFAKKFNIKLTKVTEWDNFKERFYRRNVIIHNSGYINKTYLKKTGYTGNIERLFVSKDYLTKSIELFIIFANQISSELSEKFD